MDLYIVRVFCHGIMINPLSTPIFTLMKKQAGIIIIFASSWVLATALST